MPIAFSRPDGVPPASRPDGVPPAMCLALAPLLWGGNFVVGHAIAPALDGLWINLLRWLIALALLVPLFARITWRHRRALIRAGGALTLLALLGITGFNAILYTALQVVSLPVAATCFAVTPLVILGLNALVEQRRPAPRMLCAAAIGLAGILLAQWSALRDGVPAIGLVLILSAAGVWGAYSVALKHLSPDVPAGASFLAQVLLGTLCAVPLVLIARPLPDLAQLAPETWCALAYLGLGAGALAFWLWQRGVRRTSPDRASVFMNLVPLSGFALGAVLEARWPPPLSLLALALVLFGVLLSQIPQRLHTQPLVP